MKKIILSIIVAIMMATMTTTASVTQDQHLGLNFELNQIHHPDWRMNIYISRVEIGIFVPFVPLQRNGLHVGAGISVASASLGHEHEFGDRLPLWGGFAQLDLRSFPLLQVNFLAGDIEGGRISLSKKGRIPFMISPLSEQLVFPYIGYKFSRWHEGLIVWQKSTPLLGIALATKNLAFWAEVQWIFHSLRIWEWEYRWQGHGLALGMTFRF